MAHPGASPDAALGLHEEIVGVAPHPVLAALVGGYQRMVCGVVVLRAVAAAHMAAGNAQPKMYPLVPHCQALFTPFGSIGLGCLQLVEMRAGGLCHESQPTDSAGSA